MVVPWSGRLTLIVWPHVARASQTLIPIRLSAFRHAPALQPGCRCTRTAVGTTLLPMMADFLPGVMCCSGKTILSCQSASFTTPAKTPQPALTGRSCRCTLKVAWATCTACCAIRCRCGTNRATWHCGLVPAKAAIPTMTGRSLPRPANGCEAIDCAKTASPGCCSVPSCLRIRRWSPRRNSSTCTHPRRSNCPKSAQQGSATPGE